MQIDTPLILADLMNSLQRFFKIGIYYPAGHTVADQAALDFINTLKKIAGKEGTYVHFGISETTLSIQDIDLDNSLFSVKYFHDLLHSLSISTLDIHRDINAEELRLFLARLLFLQTQIQSSRDFQELKITGLPATVKVQQLKFLANQSSSESEGSGDSSQPTIDYLLSSLVQHGLKGEQVAMCRQLLDSIPEALRKRQLPESDLPSVTWNDVERLLLSVAESINSSDQDNKTNQLGKQQNINAFVSILKSLEGTTGGSKSQEAVNLLAQITKRSQSQSLADTRKTPKPMRRNEKMFITIDELNKALEPLKNIPLPPDLRVNKRCEDLSILMQMLGQEHRLYASIRIQEALSACLRAPLDDKEWRIFIQGMEHLLKTPEHEEVAAALVLILDILRRSEHTTPLIFLRDVCKGLTKPGFVACWPFLINEAFLSGSQDEPEVFKEISSIIALLSQQEMHRNLTRIEKLNVLREKHIAPTIFSPPPASFHPLFLLLLNSSQAKYIYEQLVLGLRRHSLGWLDKAVAPLLDSTLPSHQQFIVDLLKEKDPNKPSKILKKNGASIIVEILPTIPPELRNAGWVADTIASLANVQVPGERDMLNTILTSKHCMILPVWPAAARTAARKAKNAMY